MGQRKRGWKAASGLSLDTLKVMLAEKEMSLHARRAELAAELESIDAEIGGGAVRRGPGRSPGKRGPGRPKGRRGPGRPPKSGRGPSRPKGRKRGRKPGPKGQSELHEMIRGALRASSEPLRVVDIAKKVLAAGYKTKSKVFHLIIGQRLPEMKDVKKPARGLYTMK